MKGIQLKYHILKLFLNEVNNKFLKSSHKNMKYEKENLEISLSSYYNN